MLKAYVIIYYQEYRQKRISIVILLPDAFFLVFNDDNPDRCEPSSLIIIWRWVNYTY